MNKYKKLLIESIKKKTVIDDIIAAFLIISGFANKYVASLVRMYKSYDWVKKSFKNKIGKMDIPEGIAMEKKRAWICWLQGMENAPELVKECYKSVQHWLKDWEIIVITKENMRDYVDFPDFILKKWEKGIISNTHLSDLLRLELLIRYGGLWLDATVYLTGKLPSYVEKRDFFVYRNGWIDQEMINMGSWFIYTRKTNNKILFETRNLLYLYFKKYNFLKAYFLFHMFFRMVTDKYKEDWDNVIYVNHIDQHILMLELVKGYDKDKIEIIKKISSVHKLTYKVVNDKNKRLIINKLKEIYLENKKNF